MALSNKLVMRQGQSMVLTPQLLQAIKLLQMPNIELAAYIEGELERNPLLERAEDSARRAARASRRASKPRSDAVEARRLGFRDAWRPTPPRLPQNLGTEIDNAFDPDRAATPRGVSAPRGGPGPFRDVLERGGRRRRR